MRVSRTSYWVSLNSERPYKPHLPHPIYYRVVGYADIEIISSPLIPEDGEKVVAVEVMTVEEAKTNFIHTGRPDLAELYELAFLLRKRQMGH